MEWSDSVSKWEWVIAFAISLTPLHWILCFYLWIHSLLHFRKRSEEGENVAEMNEMITSSKEIKLITSIALNEELNANEIHSVIAVGYNFRYSHFICIVK